MQENSPIQTSEGDIVRLRWPDREVILVGTAHVLQESVDLVTKTITEEKPDAVCVELDKGRYDSLKDPERWKKLNLRQVIKRKQVPTLLVNLLLASYQKRIGTQFGVRPGSELMEACRVTTAVGAQLVLSDREVRKTLSRAWASTPWRRKFHLLATLLASAFDTTPVPEAELQQLKTKDTMAGVMEEFGKTMPELRRVLIDERDLFLARSILETPGAKVVAVIGAGHRAGIAEALSSGKPLPTAAELEAIPPTPLWVTLLGWLVPGALVAAFVVLAMRGGFDEVLHGAVVWSLSTGIPAALGVLASFGHPLVALAALFAAPFTTLIPVLGVGQITVLLQAILVPPRVGEIENVTDDVGHFTRWWTNRLLRIFLVFIIPGIFTSAGSAFGGWAIIDRITK